MLNEVRELIEEGEYDELLNWAVDNEYRCSDKETLETVTDAYEILAEHGCGLAAYRLGCMYADGAYFNENIDEAISCFEQACEIGFPIAWYRLGRCYYYGQKRDYQKAFEIFAEGAFVCDDIGCLYMLAEMYANGHHVQRSLIRAEHLYVKALERADLSDYFDRERVSDIHYCFARFMLEVKNDAKAALNQLYLALALLSEQDMEDEKVSLEISKVKLLLQKAEKQAANASLGCCA